MSATVIPVTEIDTGEKGTVTTANLAAAMTVAVEHEPCLLHVKNADSTHALTIVASAGSGPAASAGDFTWGVAANSEGWICLPLSGEVCDDDGLVNLAVTVASGGALTSSTAAALALRP